MCSRSSLTKNNSVVCFQLCASIQYLSAAEYTCNKINHRSRSNFSEKIVRRVRCAFIKLVQFSDATNESDYNICFSRTNFHTVSDSISLEFINIAR